MSKSTNWSTEDLLKKGYTLTGERRTDLSKVDKPKKNKFGAKKVVYDGIKFDSINEMEFYKLLKLFKIDFVMKPKFIVQEGFVSDGKKIRAITMYPDFVIPNVENMQCVVDTKGKETDVSKNKFKMLKARFPNTPMYFPKNVVERESTINKLLHLSNHPF